MEFDKRKAAAMESMNSPEPDNSPKGNLDLPIVPLLTAINSHPSFFTTSSCSGRISVFSNPAAFVPKKKAKGGSWIFVSHDPVHPSSLLPLLYPTPSAPPHVTTEHSAQSLVFRFEPLIIAIECKDVEAAQFLVSLAISCGFRESGITNLNKRLIIAIRCSIRLEVPLGVSGKLMVSPEYVEYLVDVANEKMKANRKRTELFLSAFIKNEFYRLNENREVKGSSAEQFPSGEVLEKCEENGVAVQEGNLKFVSQGSWKTVSIQLPVVELDVEPIERLSLWGHSACCVDQKKILIFGGFGGIGRHTRRNDLLLLDTYSGRVETILAKGAPSARLGHTASLVGDSMYVIGGRADPLNILNEVWIFNTTSEEWKFLQCTGCQFVPRHRHASVIIHSKIYVFGGIHNDGIISSLSVLDTLTSEWKELETMGDMPGSLHSHSMVASGSKFYLFGGYNGEKALGNLYCFDTETSVWNKLKTSGTAPCARFSHLMFNYANYLCILGGCPISGHQVMFFLDLHLMSWNTLTLKSVKEYILARSTGSVIGHNLVIIGGGASCYAFGTKFSRTIKVDLNAAIEDIREKHEFIHLDQNECKVIKHNGKDPEFEDLKGDGGGFTVARHPWVLQLDKQYAKLVKDMLKKFGWLDLERKVYIHEDKIHICLPVTESFCAVMEEKEKELTDKAEAPNCSQFWLYDNISCLAALNLLKACGATKIVDDVVKVKKSPTTPFKVMKEAVASLLNQHGLHSKHIEQLPSRWEKLGDIIVLPVTSFEDPIWGTLGKKLWLLVAESLGTERLARQGRISQTGTRDSKLEILVGDDGWVEHRENGILYSFDATKCMFSWGNLSEKLRVGRFDCRDQVVVDMFAGIGYFTLPFLLRANSKMVYACELNPHAIEALRRNLLANSVADRCVILEGDNKVTTPKRVAHRVCLGLLPSSECSWVAAVGALRDEGGVLHIHGNVKDTEENQWTNHVLQSISDIAKSEGHLWEICIEHLERVKWYAPHIRHLVIDVRCKSIQL